MLKQTDFLELRQLLVHLRKTSFEFNTSQQTFTCSNSTVKTLEKGVKHVQS